jgi:hypothetical protein
MSSGVFGEVDCTADVVVKGIEENLGVRLSEDLV